MDRDLRLRYLDQAGLPAFPLDKYGLPIPGLVVRYFREKRVYDDPRTGK